MSKFSLLLLLLLSSNLTWALDLSVNLNQIAHANGSLMVALFDEANADNFPDKDQLQGQKVTAQAGTMTVVFKDLPAGRYAVACYHDENDNGKLDKSFFGAPKEGYGFSNNAEANFGSPSFAAAAFDLNNDSAPIDITLHY